MPSQGRRRRIAFLTNDLSSTYQARFVRSVEKAAARHDLDLLVCMGREVGHVQEHERVQNILYSHWLDQEAVDGIMVLSAALANFCGTEGLTQLCRELEPVPTCSIGLALPGVPSFVIENRGGMRFAVEHLVLHHGCRRVAYIGGPLDNEEAAARFGGYQEALHSAGLMLEPRLVAEGHFTPSTGRSAMQEILDRNPETYFDGLAVANDQMAIGATELLRERGRRVSEDVLVVSFDNTPDARYAARSLTSVAQPTDQMADQAVSALLSMLNGATAPALTHMDVHLVVRESCGCGYLVRNTSMVPPSRDTSLDALDYLTAHRELYVQSLQPSSGSSRELWPAWARRLLDALEAELSGVSGSFLRTVEEIAEEASQHAVNIDEISRAVSQLRGEFAASNVRGAGSLDLENLWMRALTLLSSATVRLEGQTALRVLARANELRHVSQRLSVALGPAAVATALAESLPSLGIENALLAVCVPGEKQFAPLLAVSGGRRLGALSPYATRQLFPSGFPLTERRSSLVLVALSFEETALGLLAFDGDTDAFVCEAMRSQVSASLKLGELHARVLEETALNERLASQQLLGEMAIAKRLQTALSPKVLNVSGLELAASMLPADQVGGDYYDVLPVEGGCWIGIGDVTGHGLLAGLIMLMIQSIVSTLVGTRPNATPAELVSDLNRVLFPNVRERLGQDEHATLLLLRYTDSGRLTFAGAHEDILVYRHATGRTELITSDGLWVGIRSDIRRETRDHALTLQPGDLLVLYSDGITEARNMQHEHFGLERLCRLVENAAEEPVEQIMAKIIAAAQAWFPVQQDDLTCLVARYTGASPSAA